MNLIKNLNYKIGDFSLHIDEWSFSDTGITALVGPSGSGKTTLFKILCGLLPCSSLSWKFQNTDLHHLEAPDRHLGVCFQDLRLFPHLSAQDNILLAAKARHLPTSSAVAEFQDIIKSLKIENRCHLPVQHLSGGEKQRVALARALICKPRFLLLDEPFTHLDDTSKKEARALTKQLIQSRKLGALLISHDREDIQDLAQEVFSLENGSLTQRS